MCFQDIATLYQLVIFASSIKSRSHVLFNRTCAYALGNFTCKLGNAIRPAVWPNTTRSVYYEDLLFCCSRFEKKSLNIVQAVPELGSPPASAFQMLDL